jgi:uncharacterized membrane protein
MFEAAVITMLLVIILLLVSIYTWVRRIFEATGRETSKSTNEKAVNEDEEAIEEHNEKG